MRISYRVSAISLLVAIAILIAGELLLPNLPPATRVTPATEPGVVSFDPCFMWRQVPWIERLSSLAWLGSLIVLVVCGLGNHRARWSATVNLITLTLNTYYEYAWTSSACLTTQDMVLWSIWFAGLVAVCFQHIFSLRRSIQN